MKNILVIGATSAVALATCRRALQAGPCRFFLVGRDPLKLEAVLKDLQTRGAKEVWAEALDLNAFDQHEALINKAVGRLGSIDWTLVAHGLLGDQRKAEAQSALALDIINTNYVSQALILNAIAQKMEAQKKGAILVLSSVAGDRGRRSNYIYGSSKAAMTAYLSGLRVRLFESKVRVLTIKMGFVDSPMTAQFKKGPLWVKPDFIGGRLVNLLESDRNGEYYVPFFWCWIMLIIRSLPSFIFNKLKNL